MKAKLIEALADVLDIDLRDFDSMSQDELLTMLESEQAKQLTVALR
jgi:hypothetical protein